MSLSWSPPGVTLAFSHPHTLPRARCGHRIHKHRVVQQPASCPVTDSNSKVCPFPHFSSFQIQMFHRRWQRKCSHGFCLAGLQNTEYLPVDGISDLMTHSVLTGDCPQRLLRTCWPRWRQPTHSQANTATSTNHAQHPNSEVLFSKCKKKKRNKEFGDEKDLQNNSDQWFSNFFLTQNTPPPAPTQVPLDSQH